jgi:RNA-directed DNA polymerase
VGSLMEEPSKLAELKAASDRKDLARLLGLKPSALAYVLYRRVESAKYQTFEIPKRRGGIRTISAPIDELKIVQRKLADLLQDCVSEIQKTKGIKDRTVHGFSRKKSIISNAHQHRKRRYVLNLDLKDFFPSINFGRVRGFFLKDKDYLLNADVATVIAQIACYQNALPQGSPCSPVISNLVGNLLDVKLRKLAADTGCTYTRYADDLTFSTNKPVFPKGLAAAPDDGSQIWTLRKELLEIIDFSGFQVNLPKTRMQYRDSRQEVTGLVVNRKVNVSQQYRRMVRTMVHNLYRKGSFTVTTAAGEKEGKNDQLHGMLGFIYRIDLENSSDKPKA